MGGGPGTGEVNPWLKLDAVVAGYDRPVVGPVSLEVERGEVLGLAGPNGTGKSTLLAAILGTVRVFSGRIECPAGVRLAHLPQRPIRPKELPLTGREWLKVLGVKTDGVPQRLVPSLDQRLDRLSGGEHQLLTLWGVLAGAGELVLLDEPTNHLDPQHVALAAQAITERRETRATLVVSHDHAFLQRVCTRLLDLANLG